MPPAHYQRRYAAALRHFDADAAMMLTPPLDSWHAAAYAIAATMERHLR